ncbi:hypothetical protein C4K05_3950 [Pseudomonas chlororaphis subsp. aureofaciens]|nr:hypothetical protein C4K06_3942 [Pseudomonas chlororaphis subsp. aureofaciens]AZE43287.1 hypothetical protein C4K05_3950 [Pseudomonas chlororaphis subsp. aureofaciens]
MDRVIVYRAQAALLQKQACPRKTVNDNAVSWRPPLRGRSSSGRPFLLKNNSRGYLMR